MSVPMEWDEPETEAVPLDLTMKKEENYPVSEVEAEIDGPGKLTEHMPLPQSRAQNDVQSTPLDLSVRRALPLQPPTSANVAQRATVVVESLPPMMAMEHLAPLHGMCSDAAAYQHKVSSSAAVPEYNTACSPVLPTSSANQFHPNNQTQYQLQHLYMQQEQLQLHLKRQQLLQLQMHELCDGQQNLQLQSGYGGVPLNPTSLPSPSVSKQFPSPTADDHHQQQPHQQDLDPEHHPHIEASATGDADVVDPEVVAAIYRQSEFLSLRQRYMESLGPPRNGNKMRRSSNNNNDNQQQNDQTYVMKRKRKNEAARKSWGAKRQKYFENQVRVMYLKKKVSEMKEIKRRLLKDNVNILSK